MFSIPCVFLALLTLCGASSPIFNLIAATSDVNSPIELYPIVDLDGYLALLKKGTRLSFEIQDSGVVSIQDSSYKLSVTDDGLLSADQQGDAIFFIYGKHLHYNDGFVFIACPQDSANTTFLVYASSNIAICENSLQFTFRPQLNETKPITSYIPSVLRSSSILSSRLHTRTLAGTAGISTVTDGTSTSSEYPFNGGLVSSDIAVETVASSTVVSTDSGGLVTQTIIVEYHETMESVAAVVTYIASTLGGGGLTTVVSTISDDVTTQTASLRTNSITRGKNSLIEPTPSSTKSFTKNTSFNGNIIVTSTSTTNNVPSTSTRLGNSGALECYSGFLLLLSLFVVF